MAKACVSVVVWLCLALALAGCVTPSSNKHNNQSLLSLETASSEDRLRAGDRVQVTVFGEEGLSGTYEVAASGHLQLPLAGAIPAAGQDAQALEQAIAAALRRRYLRDPKVTVAVVSQRPFYVLGEVEKPGEYPYRDGLDLWRALAVAGGETYRASHSAVLIQHAGERDLAEVDTAHEIAIRPGDLIRVPERWF